MFGLFFFNNFTKKTQKLRTYDAKSVFTSQRVRTIRLTFIADRSRPYFNVSLRSVVMLQKVYRYPAKSHRNSIETSFFLRPWGEPAFYMQKYARRNFVANDLAHVRCIAKKVYNLYVQCAYTEPPSRAG